MLCIEDTLVLSRRRDLDDFVPTE